MPERKLPKELIPESKLIIEKIRADAKASGDEDGYRKSEYGHNLLSLAYAVEMGSIAQTPDKQREYLRSTALMAIAKMGPKIIPLLREELRAVLTEEELAAGENIS